MSNDPTTGVVPAAPVHVPPPPPLRVPGYVPPALEPGSRPAALLSSLPPEVPAGDRFMPVYSPDGPGGSCELTCRWCTQRTRFDNPTPERVSYFCDWHRCGPPGSAWNEGDDVFPAGAADPAARNLRSVVPALAGPSPTASAEHAVTLSWFADVVEDEPVDTYVDDHTFTAAQRLLEQLEHKVRSAALGRPAPPAGSPTPGRPAHMAGGRRGGRR